MKPLLLATIFTALFLGLFSTNTAKAQSDRTRIIVCEFFCEARFEARLGLCTTARKTCQAVVVAARAAALAACLVSPSAAEKIACNSAATAVAVAGFRECAKIEGRCARNAHTLYQRCLTACRISGGTGAAR